MTAISRIWNRITGTKLVLPVAIPAATLAARMAVRH
jgi:hypothetical protein